MKNLIVNYKKAFRNDSNADMQYLTCILCCPALSPQMIGTGDVVPVTTKLSDTQRCSTDSGWAIENASKSSLENKSQE
jgi:hypothetical protein